MRRLNIAQMVFMAGVTALFAYAISTVVIFPLNGVKSVPYIWHNWYFALTWRALLLPLGSGYEALGIGLLVASVAAPLWMLLNMDTEPPLYGDAKFATIRDVRHSKSFGYDSGIIVGLVRGRLLRYVKDAFVAIAAGTRSGKGATVVITNLLASRMSVIVLDPKLECFAITSRYRQQIMGQRVFVFNPFSEESHR